MHDESVKEALAELISKPCQLLRVGSRGAPSMFDLHAKDPSRRLDHHIDLALTGTSAQVHQGGAHEVGLRPKLLGDKGISWDRTSAA